MTKKINLKADIQLTFKQELTPIEVNKIILKTEQFLNDSIFSFKIRHRSIDVIPRFHFKMEGE